MKWIPAGIGAMVAGVTLCSALTTPVAGVEVGESVEYGFRTPVVNGMGISSLSDLHGKPVLVEFWGTR